MFSSYFLSVLLCLLYISNSFFSNGPPMINGRNGFDYKPLFTVGETLSSNDIYRSNNSTTYVPVGLLDGIGAIRLDNPNVIRIFVSHEVSPHSTSPLLDALAHDTYSYTVNINTPQELIINASRISYFDLNPNTLEILDSGLAIKYLFNNALNNSLASNINQIYSPTNFGGQLLSLARFCSGSLYLSNTFANNRGLIDNMYMTGSEIFDGVVFSLDISNGNLYPVPAMSKGWFENVALMDTGNENTVAFLLGEDFVFGVSYLRLYIGQKNAIGDGSYLDRNGLKIGNVYAWVPNRQSVNDFYQTGQIEFGSFKLLTTFNSSGIVGELWDQYGYASGLNLAIQMDALNAFGFPRVEDVTLNTNKYKHQQRRHNRHNRHNIKYKLDDTFKQELFFAVTGVEDIDPLGSIYRVTISFNSQISDINNINEIAANIENMFNCQDSGNGLYCRNPDNIDFDDKNTLYVCEDATVDWELFDGNTIEGRIIQFDTNTNYERISSNKIEKKVRTIGEINRSSIPLGQIDTESGELGAWETSGILDISSLMDNINYNDKYLLVKIQARLEGGEIDDLQLSNGGQLGVLFSNQQSSSSKSSRSSSDSSD